MTPPPDLDIRVLRNVPRGTIRHCLFDFDGTISLLREGWQGIMAPLCVEVICGAHPVTPEIEAAVETMIDETTGIQTIFQMERLVEMVREYGLVPEGEILDAPGYKAVYNDRLLEPVRARLAQIRSGAAPVDAFRVAGVVDFIERLQRHGVMLYIFSGTDRPDVQNEARELGVAQYFSEIWGALPSKDEYSKEKVIRELIAAHGLQGSEILVVGDGPVELRNGRDAGGIALGLASDEKAGAGWNESKVQRLTNAGADALLPDFRQADRLIEFLFTAVS